MVKYLNYCAQYVMDIQFCVATILTSKIPFAPHCDDFGPRSLIAFVYASKT